MGATYEFPRSMDVRSDLPVVVRQISFGAFCAEFRIVGGHPRVMDADGLHAEGDELGVEERPLQEPVLVVDVLA